MRSTSWIGATWTSRDFKRLHRLHQAGAFFVTRAKKGHLDASMYTCLQILSVSVFEKTQLSFALQADESTTDPIGESKRLILFNF